MVHGIQWSKLTQPIILLCLLSTEGRVITNDMAFTQVPNITSSLYTVNLSWNVTIHDIQFTVKVTVKSHTFAPQIRQLDLGSCTQIYTQSNLQSPLVEVQKLTLD